MPPKHIGYAVIGLGDIARRAVLPAFTRATENSRLVAVVSGDRAKAHALAQQFHATAYHYDELRQCVQRDDVHAVYIALPNSMHCDYAVEAARAGAHVLCEKPMAITADECRRMLRTCQTNRVKLMIAYRLHFHPAHRRILDLIRDGAIGVPKTFSSDFTTRLDSPEDIRLQRRLGGGTVYDLGIHCINTARAVFAADPAQVMAMTARTTRRYGGDVDESAVALVRFPDERLAHLHSSFGEDPLGELTIFGEESHLRLTNAYTYDMPMTLERVKDGRVEEERFEPIDQFAATIGYFSDCVLRDVAPEPSGYEGLQDVRIVEAIYRSARDGRPVTLPRMARIDAPAGATDELRRTTVEKRHAS
jgi:predicted dehydrogenase